MTRIGLLGGSFDPVHNGHLSIARAALRQLKLDRVYFVLSPRSPFKTHKHQTNVRLRKKLLLQALKGKKGFRFTDWEIKRGGISYTIDTLRHYKKKHPRDEIFLILGSDAFLGFPRWKGAGKIAELSTLAVAERRGVKKTSLNQYKKWNAVRLKGQFPLISSTRIRKVMGMKNLAGGISG